MASSTSIINIKKESQTKLVNFLWHCRARYTYFYSIRALLEEADYEYYREHNWTEEHQRAKLANRTGDAHKFQDVTVPIVMDQVDAYTAFMTDVFCSSNPLFPVVAPPKYADAGMMMNTLLDNQARKGRWKAELIKFFRDTAKYSIGACEVSWDKVNTALLETDVGFSPNQGKPRNIIWEGNKIKRMDLYNTFWDTTVHPHEVATLGEYAGYHELVSRNRLKQVIAALGDDAIIQNIRPALESGTPLAEYYIPQVNPEALATLNTLTQGMDWFSWAGLQNDKDQLAYKGLYLLTKIYVRMLPADFDIKAPQPNTPQVWMFVIVNFHTIIYAERQTNAHEMIPILFSCPNDDGIKYQTKSLAANVKPYQQISSALMNSVIASRRRAISDKGLYNPLYVESKDINNPNPAAKIPIKPTAYAGVPLNEIYFPLPFEDSQASISMQEMQVISGMADMTAGQNKAQRGQFQKGNKTLGEFNDIMNNADSKSRMQALVLEDQFFTPLKYILNTNILQFQGSESLYHADTQEVIDIDPLLLRNAVYQFKITDGAIPRSAEMHEDVWQVAIQIIGSSPQIQQEYNLGELFSYLMKEKGADVKDFQKPPEQLQYEQAMASWQQAVMGLMKQNPNIQQNQYPPQPVPAQFGLGQDGKPMPNSPSAQAAKAEQSESLIQKILEAQGGQQEQAPEGSEYQA